MPTLKGKSGALHEVDEIKRIVDRVIIVKRFNRTADEIDILSLYIITLDTDTGGEIEAPSFTEGAIKLAQAYSITIKRIEDRATGCSGKLGESCCNYLREDVMLLFK